MLTKIADLLTLSVEQQPLSGFVRTAALYKQAHRAVFEYEPQPGYIYVRSRAISSRANDNYDCFPAEEIKKAYLTFIGKPVFVNHHNEDHRQARGVIIDAALHEDHNSDGTPDTWAEVLMEVDAVKFPKLAQAILAGHVDRTSMGCFLPGTMITMADGTHKPIEKIIEGDLVLTHTGLIEPVTFTLDYEYEGTIYQIDTVGQSQSMMVTSEHPIWVDRNGEKDWIEAKDLIIGDKVLTPTLQEQGKPGDPIFARLLGLFLAEGNFGYDRTRHGDTPISVEWNYSVNETEYISETIELIESMGYKPCGPYIKNNCATVRVNNINFAQLFLQYGGKHSWGKSLDPEVLTWDTEVQREVINGWLDGDGHYRDNRFEIGTASESLAQQMHMLMLRCGIAATPPIKQHSPSALHKRAKWVTQASFNKKLSSDGLWRKITKIIPSQYSGPVYNFDVDGDDSYVASDIAVHNCDVQYSICSACGNKATTPAEYCAHIPQLKGSKLIRRNASTGKPEETLIYETCYGLSFFENSILVEDPADPTAFFLGVDDRGLKMATTASRKSSGSLTAFVQSANTPKKYGSLRDFLAVLPRKPDLGNKEHAIDPESLFPDHKNNPDYKNLQNKTDDARLNITETPSDEVYMHTAQDLYDRAQKDPELHQWMTNHYQKHFYSDKIHDNEGYNQAISQHGQKLQDWADKHFTSEDKKVVSPYGENYAMEELADLHGKLKSHYHVNSHKDIDDMGHWGDAKTKVMHKLLDTPAPPHPPLYSDFAHNTFPKAEPTREDYENHLKKHVANYSQTWNSTSGDSEQSSIALQKAASEHFGVDSNLMAHIKKHGHDDHIERYGHEEPTPWENGMDEYHENKPFFHHYLDSVYKDTQDKLSQAGVDHVALHRAHKGYGGPEAVPLGLHPSKDIRDHELSGDAQESKPISMQPLSSWSSSSYTASGFGGGDYGHAFHAVVPKEHVFSVGEGTGPGVQSENEFVVIGGKGHAQVRYKGDGWTKQYYHDWAQNKGLLKATPQQEVDNVTSNGEKYKFHEQKGLSDHADGLHQDNPKATCPACKQNKPKPNISQDSLDKLNDALSPSTPSKHGYTPSYSEEVNNAKETGKFTGIDKNWGPLEHAHLEHHSLGDHDTYGAEKGCPACDDIEADHLDGEHDGSPNAHCPHCKSKGSSNPPVAMPKDEEPDYGSQAQAGLVHKSEHGGLAPDDWGLLGEHQKGEHSKPDKNSRCPACSLIHQDHKNGFHINLHQNCAHCNHTTAPTEKSISEFNQGQVLNEKFNQVAKGPESEESKTKHTQLNVEHYGGEHEGKNVGGCPACKIHQIKEDHFWGGHSNGHVYCPDEQCVKKHPKNIFKDSGFTEKLGARIASKNEDENDETMIDAWPHCDWIKGNALDEDGNRIIPPVETWEKEQNLHRFASQNLGDKTYNDPTLSRPMPSYNELQRMPQIHGPLGSNGGNWRQSSDGRKFLVKPALSHDHAQNEIAAGVVYRHAGVRFPNTSIVHSPEGDSHIVSEHIPDLEQHSGSQWHNNPELQKKARQHFGTDALLSHWDVHGLVGDNTLVDPKKNEPVRIESGGAMAFRGMGGAKSNFKPDGEWSEPHSMRDSEQGYAMYGRMSDDEAHDSLARAGKINMNKVESAWKQAGISPENTEKWGSTLRARQDQIPHLIKREALLKFIAALENPVFGGHDWFHGTSHDFKEFSNTPPNRNYSEENEFNTGLGTHLTSHPMVARHFFNGSNNGRIIRASLELKNPKVYKSEADMGLHAMDVAKKAGVEDADKYWVANHGMTPSGGSGKAYAVNDAITMHPRSQEIVDAYKKHLEKRGHDGIIYRNDVEDPHHPAAIVFDPKNIKIKEHNWNPSMDEVDKYFGTGSKAASKENDDCPKCQGRGEIWHLGTCDRCQGSGKTQQGLNGFIGSLEK